MAKKKSRKGEGIQLEFLLCPFCGHSYHGTKQCQHREKTVIQSLDQNGLPTTNTVTVMIPCKCWGVQERNKKNEKI